MLRVPQEQRPHSVCIPHTKLSMAFADSTPQKSKTLCSRSVEIALTFCVCTFAKFYCLRQCTSRERLTVSQAVPEPGQQSVRQKHTVWVFCQRQTHQQAVGTLLARKLSSGRMVMQRAADLLVGGSDPGRVDMPPPPLQRVHRPGFEPPTILAASSYVTIRPAVVC